MSAHDALRNGIAVANTVLANLFMPDATVELVRPSQTYGEFDTVLPVTTGRLFEYSNYRKNFLLEIAEPDTDTAALIAQALSNDPDELRATHVKVNDDIYVIEQGDTVPPQGFDVTWKVYCNIDPNKARYEPI